MKANDYQAARSTTIRSRYPKEVRDTVLRQYRINVSLLELKTDITSLSSDEFGPGVSLHVWFSLWDQVLVLLHAMGSHDHHSCCHRLVVTNRILG